MIKITVFYLLYIMLNILKAVFGESKYNNINILLENISKHEYLNSEFEMRFIDNNRISASINSYNSLDMKSLKKKSYSDNIVYTVVPTIPLSNTNIKFRKYNSSKIIEKKTLISHVTAENQIVDIPLMAKYSIEEQVKVKQETISCYQRKQRISYIFINPLLKDWRIDKTVRLLTNDPESRKLTYELTDDNVINPKYYDILDVEFEYIGNNKNILKSISLLFEYLFPKHYSILSETYISLETKYRLSFNKIFPKISIITNDIINNEDIKDYIIMEKLDGERKSLIKYNNNIYELTSTSFKIIYINNMKKTRSKMNKLYNSYNTDKNIITDLCIVETEFINNTYYLFDILYHNNQNLNDFDYIKRYNFLISFSKEIKNKLNIKLIPYKKINNWNNLITIIENTYVSSVFENINIDGFICRYIKSSFTNSIIYKIKSKKLSTIDFKLFWTEEKKCYYLYLIGDPIYANRKICFLNKYSKQHVGYSLLENNKQNNIYILFSSVFRDNMHQYYPERNIELNFENKEIKENSLKIINEMITNPTNFNGKIVEMSFYNDKWLPIKIRHDKLFSNNYKVGNSIDSLLFDVLKYKNNKEKKISILNKNNYKLYKHIYVIMNKYIIEKILNKIKNINLLYIFDNYNNTLEICKCSDINIIYAMNNNKSKLIKFVEKLKNTKKNTNRQLLISSSDIYSNPTMDINCIKNEINDNIVNSLLKKPYYIQRSINVIICERFDKVCETYSQIIDFRNIISNIININGVFIITFLDGDNIKTIDSPYYTKVDVKINIQKTEFIKNNMEEYILEGLYYILNVKNITNDYKNILFNDNNFNALCITEKEVDYEIFSYYKYGNDLEDIEKMIYNLDSNIYCYKLINNIYKFIMCNGLYLYINYNINYNKNDIEFMNNKILNVLYGNDISDEFCKYKYLNVYKNRYSTRNLTTFKHLKLIEHEFNCLIIEPYTVPEVSRFIFSARQYVNGNDLQKDMKLFKCAVFTTKTL